MLSEKILSIIETLKSGGQSAPILVSEETVCEIVTSLFGIDTHSVRQIKEKSIVDFLWYDCADTKSKNHGVEKIRKFVEQLYQKPSEDICVALFLNLDSLTMNAHNALLKVFEDVPQRLLILVTSQILEKIIPTLQSRMIKIDNDNLIRGENPYQNALDDFIL
jgi:DNA polymerase III gamma/tau subunit